MTPAQRRKKLREFKKKKSTKKLNLLVLFPLFVFLLFFVFYFFGKKYCSTNLNNTLVFMKGDGDVIVATLNRKDKEIISIRIPKNTQLDVSRQLGSWKAKSIWQLGINEKYEGTLLKETITKNLHFPVSIWADSNASGFISGNFIDLFKATFLPYKSNLSFGDRLNLFLTAFGIQNEKISSYDLSELGILKKVKLTDGEDGYIVAKEVPIYLMSAFSEPLNLDNGYMVQIINSTGIRSIAEDIGKTIEAMGLKATSIKEETKSDFDCFVSGRDKLFVRKVSQIYSCQIRQLKDNGFDIVIEIGTKFSKRY